MTGAGFHNRTLIFQKVSDTIVFGIASIFKDVERFQCYNGFDTDVFDFVI